MRLPITLLGHVLLLAGRSSSGFLVASRTFGRGRASQTRFGPQYRRLVLVVPSRAKKGGGGGSKAKSKRAARNKMGKRTASSSGFGGAAVADCPCGSGVGYAKCCGLLHKSAEAHTAASAEEVVRARYSAYAKREVRTAVDFIVGSTHPLNEQFMADIEHWKTTIRENCYDNFELTSCKILSENYEGEEGTCEEVATVQFIASMIQVDSRESTAFMETSTFKRAGEDTGRSGAWLYLNGVVEEVPDRATSTEET